MLKHNFHCRDNMTREHINQSRNNKYFVVWHCELKGNSTIINNDIFSESTCQSLISENFMIKSWVLELLLPPQRGIMFGESSGKLVMNIIECCAPENNRIRINTVQQLVDVCFDIECEIQNKISITQFLSGVFYSSRLFF